MEGGQPYPPLNFDLGRPLKRSTGATVFIDLKDVACCALCPKYRGGPLNITLAAALPLPLFVFWEGKLIGEQAPNPARIADCWSSCCFNPI